MHRRDLLRYGLASFAGLGVSALSPLAWAVSAKAQAAQATQEKVTELFDSVFSSVDGKAQSLSKYLDKPLVLNFWATWCPPCVKEMPDLDALQHKYPNINIVGLAVDTATNVVKFGSKVQVSYPLLVAGHGGIKLMRELGNPKGGLPFTIVFNKSGKPYKQFLGQVSYEDLDSVLTEFINT